MRFNGNIKHINNVVVSDPLYDKEASCRYEKNNLNKKNWLADLDIYKTEEKIGKYYIKGISFNLTLQKNKSVCKIEEDGSIDYQKNIEVNRYDIGMDSACIAFGINDKAKIITESKEYQPSFAIKTGQDGIFGEVYEGLKNGELVFLILNGYFEEDFMNENDLFDYIKNQFELTNLKTIDYPLEETNGKLEIGDTVELSTCYITSNINGNRSIRNSDFRDLYKGYHISEIKPDGTTSEIVLDGSSDKEVNLPIVVEVNDITYDYETGYKYYGKIINKDLINEFKQNLYDDSETIEVAFYGSEVIKILSNAENKEMEI